MTLIVKPVKGYLTHNTNYFTSMDPYCYLYLGKQSHKTSPHYGGGIKPIWKQTMKFSLENIFKIGVQIWTKAMIGADTLIGQGIIDLKLLHLKEGKVKQGKQLIISEYIDIQFENNEAGRVLFEIQVSLGKQKNSEFHSDMIKLKDNLQKVIENKSELKSQIKQNKMYAKNLKPQSQLKVKNQKETAKSQIDKNQIKEKQSKDDSKNNAVEDKIKHPSALKKQNKATPLQVKNKHNTLNNLVCGTVYAKPSQQYQKDKLYGSYVDMSQQMQLLIQRNYLQNQNYFF